MVPNFELGLTKTAKNYPRLFKLEEDGSNLLGMAPIRIKY